MVRANLSKYCRIIKPADEKERQFYRSLGIGASEAPAIIGIHPFSTALDVYENKVNGTAKAQSKAMQLGNLLEKPFADFIRETHFPGNKMQNGKCLYFSNQHRHCYATPDRFVFLNGEIAIIEIKVSAYWSKAKKAAAEAQLQYQMQVCKSPKIKRGFIATLIGGTYYEINEYQRDNSYGEFLIEKTVEFWDNHIERLTPPDAAPPAKPSPTALPQKFGTI